MLLNLYLTYVYLIELVTYDFLNINFGVIYAVKEKILINLLDFTVL